MGDELGRDKNHPVAGPPAAVILASDGDREAVAARLNDAVGDGRLTLEEFGERLDQAYAARTRGALAPLTADLPATGLVRGPGRLRRVMLGIIWDSRRAGPQPLEDEITAIALLGDAVIDLRGAKATSKEITIRAYALLNDVDVIVPTGVAVELSGVAVVGDIRNMTRPSPAGAGQFVVKIDGHAVLGDVQVFHSNQRAVRRRRHRRRRSIGGELPSESSMPAISAPVVQRQRAAAEDRPDSKRAVGFDDRRDRQDLA
jgi:Domain of unknown function (DUF1707)/Cell wall-active antibiotics response 4TMS YvqF